MKKVLDDLHTPYWDLHIWSGEIEPAQRLLASTLGARSRELPKQRVRIAPVNGARWGDQELAADTQTMERGAPLFFENQSYEFEFRMKNCENAFVRHRSRSVKEVFRFDDGRLRGTLNFGNDIGWFSLDVVVQTAVGSELVCTLSLEVHPTKLDMASDVEEMLNRIDGTYPLWRFAYARPTTQSMDRRRKPFERFPLLWLEQFKSLRTDLTRHVKLVSAAPHHRLQGTARSMRLEQLRGKLPRRREEVVSEALLSQDGQCRFDVASKRLSVDTPENRFVRSVLEHCDRELGRFQARIGALRPSRRLGISQDAENEIGNWRHSIQSLLSHRLWSEVGKFRGLRRESLVLQERAGYSGVYRVWLQLRMYLDVLGRHATISTKAISDLYEVWCFLEIREQLQQLGFAQVDARQPRLNLSGVEAELQESGMGAAFHFQRGSAETGDLVQLRLAHEPVFSATNRNKAGDRVVSWLNVQKPDIVIEATFPNGEALYWVFDAKYRVSRIDDPLADNEESDTTQIDGAALRDLAPTDAINQMHRYRDAIVRTVADGRSYPNLSRPVIGAFCLYPGWYPDEYQCNNTNPYADAIQAVGIGAFPALPGQRNPWLNAFLAHQLGPSGGPVSRSPGPEWQLAQWAPRIEPAGLRLSRAEKLVFIAQVGPRRAPEYLERFRNGTARWFHVRDKALVRGDIAASAMRDVTHCAVAWSHPEDSEVRITHVYRVKTVALVERSEVSVEQAGTSVMGSNDKYWLFELGESRELSTPKGYIPSPRFRAWLTNIKQFETKLSWGNA